MTDNKNRRRNSSGDSRKADGKNSGMQELRTGDEQKPEQDEERLARERARRRRRRQEMARRRRKRRRIIRMVRIFLCIVAAVLGFAGVMAVVGKYRRDKAKTESDAAAAKATAPTMETYPGSEVLNLTFPVLTLDEAAASGTSQSGSADQDETSDQNRAADQDDRSDPGGTSEDNDTSDLNGTADQEDGTENVDSADNSTAESSLSGTDGGSVLTVTEFQKILQDLYRRNYVLVDPESIADSGDGTMKEGKVSVPIGKKPLTITETGAGYTPGYDGHADSLTQKEDGSLTNTYTDSDGKVQTGDVDVITCLDAFIREHPDFSSQDARGVIAVTGQNGMFGYALEVSGNQAGKLSADAVREVQENEARYSGSDSGDTGTGSTGTAGAGTEGTGTESMESGAFSGTDGSGTNLIQPGNVGDDSEESSGTESVSADSTENADNPGSAGDVTSEITETQVEQNKETLTSLIKVLRNERWRLASGTYADISYAGDYELVKADADNWEEKIGSLLGNTDILVLPHGGDIGSWSGYSDSDSRYEYLKSLGFRYFMTENDQELTWIQTGEDYVRIGMHTFYTADVYQTVMNLQ